MLLLVPWAVVALIFRDRAWRSWKVWRLFVISIVLSVLMEILFAARGDEYDSTGDGLVTAAIRDSAGGAAVGLVAIPVLVGYYAAQAWIIWRATVEARQSPQVTAPSPPNRSSSLEHEATPISSTTEPSAPAPAGSETERLFWISIKDSAFAEDFAAYLRKYPNGEFAAIARNKLAQLHSPRVEVSPPAPPAAEGGHHASLETEIAAATSQPRNSARWLGMFAFTLIVAVAALAVMMNGKPTASQGNDHSNIGIQLASKGDHAGAIEAFGKAIRENPQDGIAHWGRGVSYSTLQDYDRAIADFDEARRLMPENPLVYQNRGLAYGGKRDYAHAIADFNESIRLDPRGGLSFYYRGFAYAQLADYERAVADYDHAALLSPENWLVFAARGATYGALGKYDLAIADYDRATLLSPNNATAIFYRGSVYQMQGDYARALTDYNEAIRLDPANAEWLNGRCWLRAVWGRELDQALTDCDRSLSSGSQAHVLDSRGLVNLRRGDFQAAFADYDAALLGDATLTDSRYGRGIARLRLGQTTQGKEDISSALVRDPGVVTRYKSYGVEPEPR